MTREQDRIAATGRSDSLGAASTLGRGIFLVELVVAVFLVCVVWKVLFKGSLDELWPAAMFCFGVTLTILLDTVIKRALLHRKPFFSPVLSIIVAVLALVAGIGMCWTMTH
jgi:hypothetical protein